MSGRRLSLEDAFARLERHPRHEGVTRVVPLLRSLASSRDRASLLVTAYVYDAFPSRAEAQGRWLELFRELAPITDSDRDLSGTLTIYRGVLHPDHVRGLSWTLNAARAIEFGSYVDELRTKNRATGPYAYAELGVPAMSRDEMDPAVYVGEIDSADVLAYINCIGCEEVVVDPDDVRNVRRARLEP